MPFASAERRRAYQRAYYRPYRLARRRQYRAANKCGFCGGPAVRFWACTRCRVKSADRKRRGASHA